ncbi:redox-regulated ATPase YchF [Patescibacteria group bacterium]|nr:redox-regulated ATPase YchF [Patescibacteria group bacterium]MCG2702403.1 redox-regulated ATPase YchF [Candidatus Parcubacteria bacterium]MBU4264826.1 redox-regulated ATPase YchF [Patescibacteria group bacterium]MBU4389697.1 redox-regulated ATPase YchF [Patescibacteria group bacterium]MBU4397393.1 redox-regulated ATPase YchF [Patescibacteria group bacterium]
MSKLSIGIVGLPNVGKSTLFNALLGRQIADASNYPFCTIEPNVGIVGVPDKKLPILGEIAKSKRLVPAVVEFVDIAGLVKGAAEGEGLGNKFLNNIRECDAICHVVRNFSDVNVARAGSTDPDGDFEVVCAELIIKDLEGIDRYIDSSKKKKEEIDKYELALKLKSELEKGVLASRIELDEDEKKMIKEFFLLTLKPFFIVVNVDEDTYSKSKISNLNFQNWEVVPVCAKLEAELADFSKEEREKYLKDLGLEESGLERVIGRAYETLGLQSFYTAGEKEARAWTTRIDSKAPEAAGVIHSDFERGFIAAAIISYTDFVEYKGWLGAKEAGKLRLEGKEYKMKADDVVEFRFNV